MLLLYFPHGAQDRAGLRRSPRNRSKRLRVLCDRIQCGFQPPVARDAAERSFIALQQLLGAGKRIVDALSADPGSGCDLAERIVLIIVEIEQAPLLFGQQLAILVVQQRHGERIRPHGKTPRSIVPVYYTRFYPGCQVFFLDSTHIKLAGHGLALMTLPLSGRAQMW